MTRRGCCHCPSNNFRLPPRTMNLPPKASSVAGTAFRYSETMDSSLGVSAEITNAFIIVSLIGPTNDEFRFAQPILQKLSPAGSCRRRASPRDRQRPSRDRAWCPALDTRPTSATPCRCRRHKGREWRADRDRARGRGVVERRRTHSRSFRRATLGIEPIRPFPYPRAEVPICGPGMDDDETIIYP